MYKEPGAYTNIDKKDLEEEVRYVVAIDNTAPTTSKNKVWSINKINAEFANQNEVQKVSSDLENVTVRTQGRLNIKQYENLVTGGDWTKAITQAITDCIEGGTIYFPEGTYNHTGITIPAKYINFLGSGRFGTFLKNTSINNAITIANNSERGSFKDIGVIGNGTLIYGSDATSGDGIVFSNNSVSWNFENVTVAKHGGSGFKSGHIGHVNNINIVNSEIEFNKADGLNFNASKEGQINAINVIGCNVANNGGNGFSIFGSSINISKNTVQGNRKYAYEISCDNAIGENSVYCEKINIENNYHELNLFGIANIKVSKKGSIYKYVKSLNFEKNFGYENTLDDSVKALINFSSDGAEWFDISAVSDFYYRNNNINTTKDNIPIIDGGNILNSSSLVDEGTMVVRGKYINLGFAKYIKFRPSLVFNNFLNAKSLNITFDENGKSSNIKSNSSIYYPISYRNFIGIYDANIFIETNKTGVRLDFEILKRNKTNNSTYEKVGGLIIADVKNGLNTVVVDSFITYDMNDDLVMRIKVYPGAVTESDTFYIYNPYFTLI